MTTRQELIDRQLIAVAIDCDLLKLTYSFDGNTLQIFDKGKLRSTWDVSQLLARQVQVL